MPRTFTAMHRSCLFHSRAAAATLLAVGGLLLGHASASATDFKVDNGFSFGNHFSGSGSSDSPEGKAAQEEREKSATEITATEETSFDERSRIATFIGKVRVRDAEFNLSCDKLTAHLSRGAGAAAGEAAKESGGLERAIAQGNVIIVQEKTNEKGEVSRYIGRAARAEYVAATGEVTLSGWPQIQQGINQQVATEEGTVMILNRNGRLKTIGGSKTVIKDSSDAQDPTRPNRRGR